MSMPLRLPVLTDIIISNVNANYPQQVKGNVLDPYEHGLISKQLLKDTYVQHDAIHIIGK